MICRLNSHAMYFAVPNEVADMVLANAVPEYSEIENALNDLGKALH